MVIFLSAIAVAAGLAMTIFGATARSRISNVALDAIIEDSPDLYRAELARPLHERLFGPLTASFQRFAKSATPVFWMARIKRNATYAGLGKWGAEGILAMKAAFGLGAIVLVPSIGALMGNGRGSVFWALLAGAFGFFAPDIWLARRANARQADIRRMLPETLDLMAIAVGAGMGLEGAIELVSRKLPGALGDELHRLLQEVQLGASRRESLTSLRDRTDVSELSTFCLTLAQADQLGSPLGEVLRAQAAEMRSLRRMRAREQAAKTPVKLLIPLLCCIFPALFVVIIGPAAISIVKAFGG